MFEVQSIVTFPLPHSRDKRLKTIVKAEATSKSRIKKDKLNRVKMN